MNTEPHQRLRSALRVLAEVEPPAGLAGAALGRAAVTRRRRTAAIAAAVVVVLALASLGARLAMDRRTLPATPPAPRFMLSAYVAVNVPANSPGTAFRVWAFNAAQRRYVPSPVLSGTVVDISDDGSRLLISREGRPSGYGVVSLADAAAGRILAVRILPWPSSLQNTPRHEHPALSPDGRMALNSVTNNKLITGFVVTDVDVGNTRVVPLQEGPYRRTSVGPVDFTLFWAPGGRGVALYQRADERLGGAASLRLFDLAGHPTRSIRLPYPVEPFQGGAVWSPNGQHLLLGYMSVLDLPSGSMSEMIGGEVKQFTVSPAGWYDDKHLRLSNLGFSDLQPQLQVLDIDTAHVVRRLNVTPPDAPPVVPVLIPLTGPAPTGAVVI